MPVRFIPNQPFIFESPIGEQICLNNDDNAYAQIVQANDTVCVQVAIDPCDEAINCEPNMFAVGTNLALLLLLVLVGVHQEAIIYLVGRVV